MLTRELRACTDFFDMEKSAWQRVRVRVGDKLNQKDGMEQRIKE